MTKTTDVYAWGPSVYPNVQIINSQEYELYNLQILSIIALSAILYSPDLKTLYAIADALDVDVKELLLSNR